ncbi:hypothetical protein L9F63_017509, partial [Diploptera punctata]
GERAAKLLSVVRRPHGAAVVLVCDTGQEGSTPGHLCALLRSPPRLRPNTSERVSRARSRDLKLKPDACGCILRTCTPHGS